MSESREFIEWLIDFLPPGWEWLGRPIVGGGILLVMLVAAIALWVIWHPVRNNADDRHDRRP